MATQLQASNALDLVRFDTKTAIGANPLMTLPQREILPGPTVSQPPVRERRRRTKPWVLSPSIINPGEWMIPETLRTRN